MHRPHRASLRRLGVILVTAILPTLSFAQQKPSESIKSFQLADGLECTLFAAEPLLANPTNIDIDAYGRVWVCEGVNYRKWSKLRPEGDRIVVLEDKNGDGAAETSTVFYQGPDINAALGICVLGNKVIVSCSPNVFVFTDIDGDLKADKKELLFTGIKGVQHDHGVHAFVFGPDGKLYFNMGNDAREIKNAQGQYIVDLAGNETRANQPNPKSKSGPYRQGLIFRCNPDGSEFETLAWNFRNNYEVAVDSFGALWQSDNDDDGNTGVRINYVMEFGNYGYQDEMTGAGWQSRRTNMELTKDGQLDKPRAHWHQNDPGVIPNLLATGAGSPCGICVYEGELLPAIFRNQIIHADAGPNVVRAYPVTPDGAGYKATIADIIKGGDKWFRPSDVCVAPDGSLFVADWYDPGVGGHAMGDNNVESLRGRIFRIAPPGHKYNAGTFDLSTPAGAVEALKSPNLARRHLAYAALTRMGQNALPALKELSRSEGPRHRARAIQLLARLDDKMLIIYQSLKDPNPDIRIAGLRMARQLQTPNQRVEAARILINDPSPQVRRECAINLRHSTSEAAPDLWATLALQHDGKDRWYLEALGLAADRNEDRFLDAYLSKAGDKALTTPAGREIIWRSRGKQAPALLAKILLDPATTAADKPRYLRAFDFLPKSEREEALASLLESPDPIVAAESLTRLKGSPKLKDAKPIIDRVLASAKGTPAFVDLVEQLDVRDRNPDLLAAAIANPSGQSAASAIRLLLKFGAAPMLEKELAGKNGSRLALALGNSPEKQIVPMLTGIISSTTHDLAARKAATTALARSKAGGQALLDLVRNKKLDPDLLPEASKGLHASTIKDIRFEADRLLPLPPTKDGQPLPTLAKLLKMKGDATRGKAVYAQTCLQCHQVKNEGVNFGPALTEIADKLGKDALYTAILYPSAGVEHNYEGNIIRTKDDEFVGLLQSETADEIQLRIAGGIVLPIKRSDIKSHRKMAESVMPEDLQKGHTTQELVDLVEYLQTLKKK